MAKGLVEQSTMTAIANAIRAKGVEGNFTPSQMADAIIGIQTGGSDGLNLKTLNLGQIQNTSSYDNAYFYIPKSIPLESIKFLMFQAQDYTHRTFIYCPNIFANGFTTGNYFYMPLAVAGYSGYSNNTTGERIGYCIPTEDEIGIKIETSSNYSMYHWKLRIDSDNKAQLLSSSNQATTGSAYSAAFFPRNTGFVTYFYEG